MIRDPSDGSVKTPPLRPTSDQNWGLKSLDRKAKPTKPAPTADDLRAHYATHNLGFQKKEKGE